MNIEVQEANWAMMRLMNHHLNICEKHPEHAQSTDGVTGLCVIHENFVCKVCGAEEPLNESLDVIKHSDLAIIDEYFCRLIKQGDVFNAAHKACVGGKKKTHVH
jgi:hypothetical protein